MQGCHSGWQLLSRQKGSHATPNQPRRCVAWTAMTSRLLTLASSAACPGALKADESLDVHHKDHRSTHLDLYWIGHV